MTRPVVLPLRDSERPGRVSPLEALAAVGGAVCWILIFPVIVLHELSHVAAMGAVGSDFKGAGARVELVGKIGPAPVYRVRSFFVLHGFIESRSRGAIISLAPAWFFVLWWLLALAGAPPPLQILAAAVGFSAISDAMVMVLRAMGHEAALGLDDTRPVFLVGGPDQWQTELGVFA